MIIPQQTDLGRRVVYRPPGVGRRYGVISARMTMRMTMKPQTLDTIVRRRSSRNLVCRHRRLGFSTLSRRPSPLSQWFSGLALRQLV
jgi:hypothetical protein